jgi:hypothetical protein
MLNCGASKANNNFASTGDDVVKQICFDANGVDESQFAEAASAVGLAGGDSLERAI